MNFSKGYNMHDLNTIAALNAKAIEDSIANFTGQGRYVVATYSGLRIVSVETFSHIDDAQAAVHDPVDDPSGHRALHLPRPGAPARTLGDYVKRALVAE